MIEQADFTLHGICRSLGISPYELPFAEPQLGSGHVSEILTPEAPQIWRRLFFAWLSAIENVEVQRLTVDLDRKLVALRQDPEFAKGKPARAALKQVIARLEDDIAPPFSVFREWVLTGYRTLQRERMPAVMLEAQRRNQPGRASTAARRRAAYQEIIAAQRLVVADATEFRDVVKLLWAGWKDLSFWKYQPKNIHRSRGDLTLAGLYRDSAAERLDEVFALLVTFEEFLKSYANLLEEFAAASYQAVTDDALDLMAEKLQRHYLEMAEAESALLYKVGQTASRCAEWANYHAGSNFIAQLRGSSDELMAWIEVSDRAYATGALTATTLATALGTPIAGGVVGGVALVGGIIKKKVADESIIRAYADRKGVFDLPNVVSASTLGRYKQSARKAGKKAGKVYGLVIEPGNKIAEFAVTATHAIGHSGMEAWHGVGTVVGDAAKILEAVVHSTKETTFSSQDRNAARSQLAVMASITGDLSSFKRAHRALGGKWGPKLQSIGDTAAGPPATVADFAARAHEGLCAVWYTNDYNVPGNHGLALGGFDSIGTPEKCYFLGAAGPGAYLFSGVVMVSYGTVADVPWQADFTCTAEHAIRGLKLTKIDGVWGTMAWKDGNATYVSHVVGEKLVRLDENKQFVLDENVRYVIAFLDDSVYRGQLLRLGAENSLLNGNQLKSDFDLAQLKPPLPAAILNRIKQVFK